MIRAITTLIGTLAFVAGCYFLASAFLTPNSYWLRGASAVQVTQVYTEATYQAVMAIAAFVLAGLIAVTQRKE